MAAAFVVFRLDGRTFATSLDDVREIVRLERLEPLPGARPPLVGIVVLRGAPLPVLDVRAAADVAVKGDILVMDSGGDTVGVAVDQVLAVLGPHDLPEGDAPSGALPPYVVGVRRYADAPVLLVDLHRLLDTTAEGWTTVVEGDAAPVQT